MATFNVYPLLVLICFTVGRATAKSLNITSCNYGVHDSYHYVADICLYDYELENEDMDYPHYIRIECDYSYSEPRAYYRPYYDTNCTQPIDHDENERLLTDFRCCQNCSEIDDCHPFYMVEKRYEEQGDEWEISKCTNDSLLETEKHFALYADGSDVCVQPNPSINVLVKHTYSYNIDNITSSSWVFESNCTDDPSVKYIFPSGCSWVDITNFDGSIDIEICPTGDCINNNITVEVTTVETTQTPSTTSGYVFGNMDSTTTTTTNTSEGFTTTMSTSTSTVFMSSINSTTSSVNSFSVD